MTAASCICGCIYGRRAPLWTPTPPATGELRLITRPVPLTSGHWRPADYSRTGWSICRRTPYGGSPLCPRRDPPGPARDQPGTGRAPRRVRIVPRHRSGLPRRTGTDDARRSPDTGSVWAAG